MTELTGIPKILDNVACELLKKAEETGNLDYMVASTLVNNLCLQAQLQNTKQK